ncbi:YraN family protein [Guyparkeria sp. 1SP6A2]|nr:YraN family protein [Guyparkeria sp. 1SP6A2]
MSLDGMGTVKHWWDKRPTRWTGTRQSRGQQAEHLARRHLEQAGLQHLQSNARAGRGEIDLIMRERDTLVFVEVRARGQGALVTAAESLSARKCAKVRDTAQRLITSQPGWQSMYCRFDVIAVIIPDDHGPPAVEWLVDAF